MVGVKERPSTYNDHPREYVPDLPDRDEDLRRPINGGENDRIGFPNKGGAFCDGDFNGGVDRSENRREGSGGVG
jgi:hypothetical protein